jgi:AcrR family transcriptional regulator
MSTTAPYHHGDLRRALLDEASTVLEESGPGAISMRDLARRLGVSHAAPGHHFEGRSGLLEELAADGYSQLADALESAMTGPRASWLHETGRAYVRFALAHPQRYRLMFTTGVTRGECGERLALESSRAYLALLRSVYGELSDLDPSEYRLGPAELRSWSLVHGAVMLWIDGQLDETTTEARFLELVDEMLANGP